MASGKKNYFRHSFSARNDHRLKAFMELFGRDWKSGYFYFFTLLEMCGEDALEGKIEHTIHLKTLRELWGISTKSAQEVCTKFAESALIMCTFSANSVSFSIPNLGKYLGRYDYGAPNKRKEKEKKEKEIENSVSVSGNVVEISDQPKKKLPKKDSQEKLKNDADIINTNLFNAEPLLSIEEVPTTTKAANVLNLLNSILFLNHRPTAKNYAIINARLNEGYDLSEFAEVFKYKLKEWGNDAKMKKYLRLQTLLSNSFDGYLQQAKNADKPILDPLEAYFLSLGHLPERFEQSEGA